MPNFEIADYVKIAVIGFLGVFIINHALTRFNLAQFKA